MFKKPKNIPERENTPFLFEMAERSCLERPMRNLPTAYSDSELTSHVNASSVYTPASSPSKSYEPLFKTCLSHPETLIGPSVQIKGLLIFEKHIRIDGRFEGQILGQGKIHIGPQGLVKANLTEMDEVIIEGSLEGNIIASKRVEVCSLGKVIGDITTPTMAIAEGSVIVGKVTITPPEHALEHEEEPNFSSCSTISNLNL